MEITTKQKLERIDRDIEQLGGLLDGNLRAFREALVKGWTERAEDVLTDIRERADRIGALEREKSELTKAAIEQAGGFPGYLDTL